jgi:plastocyanin
VILLLAHHTPLDSPENYLVAIPMIGALWLWLKTNLFSRFSRSHGKLRAKDYNREKQGGYFMKSRNIIIGLVVVAILVVGWLLARPKKSEQSATPQPTQSSSSAPSSAATSQNAVTATATITYSENGFDPKTVTVKMGETVAIKNDSSDTLQFDSDPHPQHTDNTELNVGVVNPGQAKTVTLNKTGTFGYHNHLNPTDKGSITVQ